MVGVVVGTRDTDDDDDLPTVLVPEESVSPAPTIMPSSAPSLSPTSIEFANLARLIAEASLDGGAAVEDPSSPQHRAIRWLSNNAKLDDYPDTQRIQRYALAVLYYSTNGKSWLQDTNWMTDEPECDWFNKGVTFCDAVSKGVSNLNLKDNNLVGKLPSEVYLMSESIGKRAWGSRCDGCFDECHL